MNVLQQTINIFPHVSSLHYTPTTPEDPTKAELELSPPFHLVSCEYNSKDGNLLAGGCYNGQVTQGFITTDTKCIFENTFLCTQ